MDDNKHFNKDDNKLKGILNTVIYFSDVIGIDVDLLQCAKLTFKWG